MTPLPLLARALRAFTLAWLPLLALASVAPAAQAGPLVFAPFSGSGNAVVFDPGTGDGGWVGSIEQFPEPGLADPLQLVSVVTFRYDAVAMLLRGEFTFTRSADLGASLFGQVSGSSNDADVFGQGGQIALDYSIQGGTGDFAGASGFGLSFLQFDPAGTPDNYQESGLLVFAVPEPGSLLLAAGALLALGLLRRRQRH
jgi:hypothetical protein